MCPWPRNGRARGPACRQAQGLPWPARFGSMRGQ
jgi:hypothetical protein